MKIHALIIAIFAVSIASGAFAAPDPPTDPDKDKKLEEARAAIAAENWGRARDVLRKALRGEPRNAEYHNLYAYAMRKGERPAMDLVFRHYHEALRLRPDHRGAHEYLGEAYLMTGNLAKAREHLAVLERLCGSCDEQAKLSQAISTAERQSAAK